MRPLPRDALSLGMPRAALLSALTVLVAAVILRRGQFGNPIAGLDEQLYLLAGQRMWHGELPYVAIWDRKPFGLFLLFAAIQAIPGNPFLIAQLVATGFSAATAWVVALFAQRWTGWGPATLTGLFYLAGEIELWGDTTQSPVFYNLAIAAAALLTWRASRPGNREGADTRIIAAMLLAGLAVQVKTNAVFEGTFFALWHLGSRWRAERDAMNLARRTALLAVVGASPTLAVMAFYAGIGAFPAWWQANVLSILAKGRPQDAAVAGMFIETWLLILPIVVLTLFGFWVRMRGRTRIDADSGFMIGWVAAAAVDFIAIGGYYPHYALPLLLAASLPIAHAFAFGRIGKTVFVLALLWPLAHTQIFIPRSGARDRAIAEQVRAAIPADVRTRCLFVFEGPVAYYQLTDACRVTRYPFSAHISSRREAAALGEPPRVALDAAMSRRPGTVITVTAPARPDRNAAMEARLLGDLHRDYRPIAYRPHRFFTTNETLVIWRRNDLR